MLMKQHRELDEKKIIDNFPLGAARHLIPIKDERRATGLDFVAHKLMDGKHISGKDIQQKLEISNNKPQPAPVSVKEPHKKEIETSQKKPEFPDHVPPAPVTVPLTCDPATPPQPSLAAQQAAKEPAFKTALEVKEGLMAPVRDGPDPIPVFREMESMEHDISPKERRNKLADELMGLFPERFQMEARDYLRNNNRGARTNDDLFYFGVEMLVEKGGK